MKVVITGGEGFIGKALAAALSKRGAEVIIIDRKRGIEAKDFFDTVPNLNEADCVYHLAAQTSVFNGNHSQIMHDNIYAWYADEREASLWRPALKHITFKKEREDMSSSENPFAGKVVVATGKLEKYTRDGIQMKLLSLGAKPTSSVSKKTDYLIVGENAGSKLSKAQSLGVKTLTEQDFEQMLADAGI